MAAGSVTARGALTEEAEAALATATGLDYDDAVTVSADEGAVFAHTTVVGNGHFTATLNLGNHCYSSQ